MRGRRVGLLLLLALVDAHHVYAWVRGERVDAGGVTSSVGVALSWTTHSMAMPCNTFNHGFCIGASLGIVLVGPAMAMLLMQMDADSTRWSGGGVSRESR